MKTLRISPDRVSFRVARPDDYDAAVAINQELYGGADYLPTLYDTFARDPNIVICVAEVDGKMVSLAAVMGILGGRAGLGFMGRTSPAYQHLGVSVSLIKYLKELYQKMNPRFEALLYVALDSEFHTNRYNIDPNYSLLAKENRIRFATSTQRLARELSGPPFHDLNISMEQLTPELLARLDTEGLFPGEYMITSGGTRVPREAKKASILKAMQDWKDVVMTRGFVTRKPEGNGDKVRALSLSHTKAVKNGIVCILYFYGDAELFGVHLQQQMTMLNYQSGYPRRITLMISFPETIPVEGIQRFLQRLTDEEIKPDKLIIVRESINRASNAKL